MSGPWGDLALYWAGLRRLRNVSSVTVLEDHQIKAIANYSSTLGAGDQVPAFEVLSPDEHSVPFVFNSPHSGRAYLSSFLQSSRLDTTQIRQSEDAFVDLLIKDVEHLGAPVLKANFPRAYIDVNREAYELDPKMFEGKLPKHINSRSLRVAGGLGTIARIVGERREIYHTRIPAEEGLDRIERVYKPYHNTLRGLLNNVQDKFGLAVLVDCHSMPSANSNKNHDPKADFVIGDRFGTSCSAWLSSCAVGLLQNMGYNVALNRPYAGGYITENYGRPERGIHALQVEINRALYMDEHAHQPHSGFHDLRKDLMEFLTALVEMVTETFTRETLAAE